MSLLFNLGESTPPLSKCANNIVRYRQSSRVSGRNCYGTIGIINSKIYCRSGNWICLGTTSRKPHRSLGNRSPLPYHLFPDRSLSRVYWPLHTLDIPGVMEYKSKEIPVSAGKFVGNDLCRGRLPPWIPCWAANL